MCIFANVFFGFVPRFCKSLRSVIIYNNYIFFDCNNYIFLTMRKSILCALAMLMSIVAAKAQDDVLLDYVWNKNAGADTVQNDVNRTLVLGSDTMPTGRFKQPLKFTKAELNKIKDPRVRDIYWYALNDTTDSKRYLKAHYAFNEARDNWAFEFGGGIQSVFMMSIDDEFSLGPQFEIGFKKDLHPYWAARFVAQYSKYQKYATSVHESTMVDNWQDRPTETMPAEGWRQHLNYQTISARADVMLNLLNLAAGRELLYNPYDMFLYVGSGGAFSARKIGERDGSCFVPLWLAGFKIYANFTQRWSMALDLNCSWQGDDLEGFSEQNSTLKTAATLGFSYKFSRVIHFQRLGYDDSALKQQLNEAYEEGDRLATYIQNAKKDTIVNLPADLITAAFFQIDRIELAHTYVLNLGFYADLIKSHPNQKFLVRGFADLEVGSQKRNEWLREKRAQVVADVLVKTYGVDENQLVVGGGDLNIELPFLREDGHHRFNRCTIVCPLTKDYQFINETEFDDNAELMDGRVKSSYKKNY